MPRASWRGFLRLSLVSCPIYLSPATTRAKSIRLHQVWQPAPVDVAEDALFDRGEGQQGSAASAPQLLADDTGPDGDQSPAATRVTLRPHDPATGEEIDKRRVVKGYEYARGEFVTFTAEELKALDVESSKAIDLEKFVPRNDIDPVYFDSSYYLHPDGPIAVETLRVIGAAMAKRHFLASRSQKRPPASYSSFRPIGISTATMSRLSPFSTQYTPAGLCRVVVPTTSTRSPDGHPPPFCNSLETIRTSVSRSVTSKSNSSSNSAAVARSCCIRVAKSAAS
jgi:hypothetical protein